MRMKDKNIFSCGETKACSRQGVCACIVKLSYLSGSRSTMPITMIFFPGRMPPRIRPLKGTVCAKCTEFNTQLGAS